MNAPTSLNLGVVYPQALLIWTIGITYSIITPLILPFAMLYFGLAYFVYKYRFLFVFCESRHVSGFSGRTGAALTRNGSG